MNYKINRENKRIISQFKETELTVIELCMSGMSNIEIAEHIGYSERTIKRVMQKLRKRFCCDSDRQLLGMLGNIQSLWQV